MFINVNIRATLQQKPCLVLYKKKGYLVLKDYLVRPSSCVGGRLYLFVISIKSAAQNGEDLVPIHTKET